MINKRTQGTPYLSIVLLDIENTLEIIDSLLRHEIRMSDGVDKCVLYFGIIFFDPSDARDLGETRY